VQANLRKIYNKQMNLPVQSMGGVIVDSERNHLASSIADSERCYSEASREDDIEANVNSKLLCYNYKIINNHDVLKGEGIKFQI
jgi:hypothetical protein